MARMTGIERKRQIAETTLDLLATEGVQGTTNARIAQAVPPPEFLTFSYRILINEFLNQPGQP